MSAENNVPAIRFKGFSGDWEGSELGKLLDITSAARVHKDEWTDAGVPFFRTSDVVSIYKGQENKKAYISFELYKELSARTGPVKKDDILITGGGSIGIPYLITTSDPMYFKDADLLWLKNTTGTNGYLLFTFFSSPPFRKYISGITHIGTISHYTIEQAKTTPINISKESEEQTKIGNYFQQLDILIARHQQKHDKLLNLKKALLEKMFPKQGATVPEIRFKGFSGEWEEKDLENSSDLLTGNPFDSKEFSKRGVFLVRGMNVKRGYLDMAPDISEYWSTSLELEKFLLKEDDIVIQMDGALIGKSYAKINNKNLPALLVQRVTRIRSREIDPDFTYQYIQRDFLKHISKIKTETAVPHLSLNDIRNFPISVPKTEEQTKIGNLFKKLDTLLNQHQAQIKKLNNIKQACLEKMFV